MEKYSTEVHNFIVNVVLPRLGFKEYNDDNIEQIVDYMFAEIETPLCSAEDDGEILNPEEKEMLRLVTKAITEITTRSDWY